MMPELQQLLTTLLFTIGLFVFFVRTMRRGGRAHSLRVRLLSALECFGPLVSPLPRQSVVQRLWSFHLFHNELDDFVLVLHHVCFNYFDVDSHVYDDFRCRNHDVSVVHSGARPTVCSRTSRRRGDCLDFAAALCVADHVIQKESVPMFTERNSLTRTHT